MVRVLIGSILYLGCLSLSTVGFSDVSSENIHNFILNELENVIENDDGSFFDGIDPLRIDYLPIPISLSDYDQDINGYIEITKLEISGLSKIKWNTTYNTTTMTVHLDFSLPELSVEIESLHLEMEIKDKKFMWNEKDDSDPGPTLSGSGLFASMLENFKISIDIKIGERKNRLRAEDVQFNIDLDWCDLYWDNFIIDDERITEWEEISELLVSGVNQLNDHSVAPYVEETILYFSNIILLTMETTTNNFPEYVESLGVKLLF